MNFANFEEFANAYFFTFALNLHKLCKCEV